MPKLTVEDVEQALDDSVRNEDGFALHGRAAAQATFSGEKKGSKNTAAQNAELRETRKRWLELHPEDAEEGELESLAREPDPGVPVDMIAAPGIVYDKYTGKTWTLPTDSMVDAGLMFHRSPYAIKKLPGFHYEFHRKDEVADMMSQGFVPVTREELGIDELSLQGDLKGPLDRYYVVGDTDVCMKIPTPIAERRYKALKQISDAARDAVRKGQITTAAAENIRESGATVHSGDGVEVSGTLDRTITHSESE